MKKKMVFHFYCDYGWKTNPAVKLHLECIKHYSHFLDDVVVVICTDRIEDKEFINGVKCSVVNAVDCNSLTINVVKNTSLREAKTFFDEVVNKDYDGVVLFTHTKGYTNFDDDTYNKQCIKEWIVSSYWINFNFLDEMELSLSYGTKVNNALFYGAFLIYSPDGILLEQAAYAGSMFWTNMRNVNHEMFLNGEKVPQLSSRMSAEQFPGSVCYILKNMLCMTHKACAIYSDKCDLYGKIDTRYGPKDTIKLAFPEDFESYCSFENEIYEKSGV